MIVRHAVPAVLCLVVVSIAGPLFADVTGTWSGTLSGQDSCSNGSTVAVSLAVELDLLQSGGLVTGAIQGTGPLDSCTPGSPTVTVVFPLNGSVSGSTFSATFVNEKGKTKSFGATVNGTSMSVTADTLSGTFTQTSTQAPQSGLTGTYTGTYSNTIVPCGNPPGITNTGTATVDLIQVGTSLTGSITISDSYRDICNTPGSRTVVDDGPGSVLLAGQISGSTVTGFVNDGKKNMILTATISGNTISGSVAGTNSGDGVTFTATRTSTGTPAPVIASFTANPSMISSGASSVLSWSAINAGSVSIDNGVGTQPQSGTVNISPSQTTTYTLTATGIGGSSTATTTITVTASLPQIVLGTLPSGMLEATGAPGATDSFTLSNVGSAAADVTLTQGGSFFTLSPASFTIPAGSSQLVEIRAGSQAAGTYDGSISVSPSGISVPVHLLVAAAPTAPVVPQPAQPRTDVSAPAGQSPSGSVSFTNAGSGTLTGIAVADVPWIVPQSGAITIAPGAMQNVTFTIDRTKRPDGAAPNGGAAGSLSLVYLTSVAGKRAVALGTTPTATISVTIVDVVKPGSAPGAPQPLAAGQIALFVDGLRTSAHFNGDLAISSRASLPSISDLQLFFTGGGNPTQLAAIPSFAPNMGVSFPALAKNVFGVTASGSLQIRSSQAASIALSAVVSSNGPLSTATALPVLRSDRGIGAGERSVFSGAQDSETTVYLQEVSGNAGHVSIQYLDGNGLVVGTDSGDLPPFGAAGSAAPDGTRSVVVLNDSTGSARVAAYAAVVDLNSLDEWVLTDPLHHFGPASGDLIVPLVQTSVASSTDLFVTNASSTATSVTIAVNSGGRQRAIHAGGASQRQPQTLGAESTLKTSLGGGIGYVRVTSASGPVSAAGRLTITASGASFGSTLPAVPVSASLASGTGTRFTAVDDASQKTVSARTAGTSRATLMLIETSGQNATVRVTLRFDFVAGGSVGSQGVSSSDFSVGPNGMLTIGDLGRSVIGAQRDALGDLRGMQVDVDVTGGSGKVLPFLQSTDNASGDIMVRAE